MFMIHNNNISDSTTTTTATTTTASQPVIERIIPLPSVLIGKRPKRNYQQILINI